MFVAKGKTTSSLHGFNTAATHGFNTAATPHETMWSFQTNKRERERERAAIPFICAHPNEQN